MHRICSGFKPSSFSRIHSFRSISSSHPINLSRPFNPVRMSSTFTKGDIVQHYKGGYYKILDYAKHTETEEDMVIYRAIHYPSAENKDTQLWARPQKMFDGKTEDEKGLLKDRFVKVPSNTEINKTSMEQ